MRSVPLKFFHLLTRAEMGAAIRDACDEFFVLCESEENWTSLNKKYLPTKTHTCNSIVMDYASFFKILFVDKTLKL